MAILTPLLRSIGQATGSLTYSILNYLTYSRKIRKMARSSQRKMTFFNTWKSMSPVFCFSVECFCFGKVSSHIKSTPATSIWIGRNRWSTYRSGQQTHIISLLFLLCFIVCVTRNAKMLIISYSSMIQFVSMHKTMDALKVLWFH
jgi:hypothetical protein